MKDIIFGVFFGSIALGVAAAIMLAVAIGIYAVKNAINEDRKKKRLKKEGWE